MQLVLLRICCVIMHTVWKAFHQNVLCAKNVCKNCIWIYLERDGAYHNPVATLLHNFTLLHTAGEPNNEKVKIILALPKFFLLWTILQFTDYGRPIRAFFQTYPIYFGPFGLIGQKSCEVFGVFFGSTVITNFVTVYP